MISCISPNAGSCEHTLNTLRYADRYLIFTTGSTILGLQFRMLLSRFFWLKDYNHMNRVKSLSKSSNTKKDQVASSLPPSNKESISASSFPVSADVEDDYEQYQEVKVVDTGRRVAEKEYESNKQTSSNYAFNSREDSGVTSGPVERERVDKPNFGFSTGQKTQTSSYLQNSIDAEEKVQKVSPPRRKVRDEKNEKLGNWLKNDSVGSDLSTTGYKQQNMSNFASKSLGSRQYEPEPPSSDGNINEILEVGYSCTLLSVVSSHE